MRMAVSATLKSRLASASAAACSALAKAPSTSVSPLVKAMPLARKPMTGMTAIATMRVRTETLEMSRAGEVGPMNGSGMLASTCQMNCDGRSRKRPAAPEAILAAKNSQIVNNVANDA